MASLEHTVEGVSQRGFVQSMSRKGDCWDNAVAESFFHLLKTELTYHCRWLNYQAAYRSLFEYIEIFYNRERSHACGEGSSPTRPKNGILQLDAKALRFSPDQGRARGGQNPGRRCRGWG